MKRSLQLLTASSLIVSGVVAAHTGDAAHGGDESSLPPSTPLADAGAGAAFYVVLDAPPAIEVAPHDPAAFREHAARLRVAQTAIEARLPSFGARALSRYTRLVNALQVFATPDAALRLAELPGVRRVERVPVVRRANSTAVPYIGGQAVWANLGFHGEGMRVGIVDTGVDYTHADFGGPGTPAAYKANDPDVVEPGSFPTAKVVGGVDLVGDAYDPASGVVDPKPDADPLDCAGMQMMNISGGHGTHVAGTVAGQGVTADGKPYAGPYDLTPNLLSFRVGPGVAPEAKLYAIKIFGCEGATTAVTDALEWAVDPNDDGDTSDRLDVLNLSLGGSYGLPTATDEQAVNNLVAAGAFLAIAAGNDGDATFVTGAPGTYSQVLSVAAVTDVITYRVLTVTAPGSLAGDKAASEGAFTKSLGLTGSITGDLVATAPTNGCGTLTNKAALAGKIAFVRRGSCTFVSKVQAAAAAGAVAVVVADNQDAEAPFSMGGDGTKVDVPGVMIRKVDGDPIADALAAGQKVSVVLDAQKTFPSGKKADQLAGFSSRGPRSLDMKLKPEIAAPGVGINSAGVASGTEPRDLSGTSMATPMVAGAVALMRQANPTRSPFEIKAMLMNTAVPASDDTGAEAIITRQGSGRVAVDAAISRTFIAFVDGEPGEVALSFGAKTAFDPYVVERKLVVRSFATTASTVDLATAFTHELPGVTVTVSPASVSLPAGGEATATVTLAVDPALLGDPPPDSSTPEQSYNQPRHHLTEITGFVTLAAGAETARVPFYGATRAAARRKSNLALGCSGPDVVEIPIVGESRHPSPSTMLLELGATDTAKDFGDEPLKGMTDLVATGAATNLPTAESFGDASLYFGVAVAGEWYTPTYAALTVVSVELDTNDDGKVDYRVNVEPFTKDMPYADVLIAQTYKASGAAVESKRFINVVPRTSADTSPYMNGVLVLPVTVKALALTEGSAKIAYRARTQAPSKGGEFSPWSTFDLEHPRVQPMGGVKVVGKQIETNVYTGAMTLKAKVDRSQGPVSALLLHAQNEAGSRAEVVSLDEKSSGVSLAAAKPASAKSGEAATFTVTVSNGGEAPVTSYAVKLAVTGGSITSVSGGNCTADGSSCVLDQLAAKSSTTLSVVAKPAATATKLSLSASGECAAADASVEVTPATMKTEPGPAVATTDEATPSGGCSCETTGGERGGLAAVALGLAAVLLRRRRP